MIKAFLSHSSVDKDIVRKIKTKLQRIWTYFDEDCFKAGEDFRKAIRERLDDTNLFVLFVSTNSLDSSWVQFEIDEAYWQTIQRKNIRVLVLTLEDISVAQLPEWMRKGKFQKVTTPQLAAQLIKNMLFESVSISNRVYMGRESNIRQFYEDINNYEPNFPNIIAVVGLDGIGRRTFIKDIISKRFSIDYSVEFNIEESENIIELYRKLLDDNIEDNSSESISKLYGWFLTAPINDRACEIARVLALYTQNYTCPILIDNGSMLSDDGHYNDGFLEILRCFATNYQDHYLIILHTRLPKISAQDKQLIYLHRLYALDNASCYSLFDSLLKRNNVPVADHSQVKEIAEYLEGYPPAIINATRECMLDGIDIVCNDKSSLIDFQSRLFTKYLNKVPLLDADMELLTAIYNVGNASIHVLSVIMNKSVDSVGLSLKLCHDYNIVEQRSNGTYTISPPMSMAIDRKLARYDKAKFSEISNSLIKEFWKPDNDINFEVIDIIINAILQSGQDQNLLEFKSYVLPSHLLKAAERANQATDWALAEKYARKALELDNQLTDARILIFKELVRQETPKNIARYDSEENDIIDILRGAYDKRHYYLEGFRFWKRHKFYDAIESFKLAISSGDNSIPVHRDLAECYYQTGQVPEAKKEIGAVVGTRKITNPYILDLASKIAISLGDLELAKEYLGKQELVDRYENIEHRRATYFIKADDYNTALIHSTNACNGDRVLPEMHLLRMNIGIHLKDINIVDEEYQYIKGNYKHYSYDTCEVLYTTMLLSIKGWKVAEAGFAKVNNKESPIALNLKHKILTAKLEDTLLSPIVRQEAEIEKKEIERKRMTDILFQFQYYDHRS